MNELFRRRLVGAAQFGVWTHDAVSIVFGVKLSAAKDASAGRYGDNNEYSKQFHSNPTAYVRNYMPGWLFEALDKRIQCGQINEPSQPDPTVTKQWMVDAWRSRFNVDAEGTPKFTARLRNAVLYEAARINEDDSRYWSDLAFTLAFGLGRATIDGMRRGTSGLYARFHTTVDTTHHFSQLIFDVLYDADDSYCCESELELRRLSQKLRRKIESVERWID